MVKFDYLRIVREHERARGWTIHSTRRYKTKETCLRRLRAWMDSVPMGARRNIKFTVYDMAGDRMLTVTWNDEIGWQDKGPWA